MISVVIPTSNAEATLAATLTALVPAAVEGLVREVIVVAGGSTDKTAAIVEDTGGQPVHGTHRRQTGPNLGGRVSLCPGRHRGGKAGHRHRHRRAAIIGAGLPGADRAQPATLILHRTQNPPIGGSRNCSLSAQLDLRVHEMTEGLYETLEGAIMKLRQVVLSAVAACALAATATSASAGESLKDRDRPFSWTGFYMGAQVGLGISDKVEVDDDPGPGTTFPVPPVWDHGGWLAGGFVGYNFQSGSFVIGIEGDINATEISGRQDNPAGAYSLESEVNWLASARGRVGVAAGSTLYFVTGGVAWANISHTQNTVGDGPGTASKTMTGWTAGGGLEHALSKHATMRVEYRYYNFHSVTLDMPTPYTTREFKMDDLHTFTAGLAWKF
jgi:outer membrane immunogenic protein